MMLYMIVSVVNNNGQPHGRYSNEGGQFITIASDDPEAIISLRSVATIGSGLLSRKLGPDFQFFTSFVYFSYDQSLLPRIG